MAENPVRCSNCGAYGLAGARFCVQCGSVIAADVVPATMSFQQAQPATEGEPKRNLKATLAGQPSPVRTGGAPPAPSRAKQARRAAAPEVEAEGPASSSMSEALAQAVREQMAGAQPSAPAKAPLKPATVSGPEAKAARADAATVQAKVAAAETRNRVPGNSAARSGSAQGAPAAAKGKGAAPGASAAVRAPQAAPRVVAEPTPPAPETSENAPAPVASSQPDESAAQASPARQPQERTPAAPLPISQMLEDIDDSFDAIFSAPGSTRAPATAPAAAEEPRDRAEVEHLFKQIALTYLGPVRDFMVELELDDPPKEWIDVCKPAVVSMQRSAVGIGLEDLAGALGGLAGALEEAGGSEGNSIGDAGRHALKSEYAKLVKLIPETFGLQEERDRREPIIVQSLLRQVPEVRAVALGKLYGAGLTTLRMFYMARPNDVADATGLPLELCERIIQRFRDYKNRIASIPPDPGRTGENEKVEELTEKLKQYNQAFEGNAKSWSSRAAKDKRRLRQQRSDVMLEINVLLARLGEVGLVMRLERLTFQRKVKEIERYLEASKARAQKGP